MLASRGAGAWCAVTTRLAFVGSGPRAIMLLERLLARLDADAELEIDLIDPYPAGAGRIWRRTQSPLLKLNSMASDVTVFTDDTCTIAGPIRPGPSLITWVEAWRDGALPEVHIDDDLAAAEALALRGDSFPTRRLQSYYLEWFAARTIADAPAGVRIRSLNGTVTSVHRGAERRWGISLAGGAELSADVVIYALGHNGRAPDAETTRNTDAAQRSGFHYVGPDFTADADLDGIGAGEDVIVRGMGLAAVDLVVLLTQGRGGRFVGSGQTLRYLPSGREPRLFLGSRRGVPYRSKVSSVIQGDPPQREVLTPEVIAALAESPRKIDFETDVWPLIAAELLHGHYRELFTGHPNRVRGSWQQAREILQRHAWDDPALTTELADLVPDPLDRLAVASLDHPLAGESFANPDEANDRVVAHIREDLLLRTTQEHSAAQGVFFAVLLSYLALSEIPAAQWNARSRAVSLPLRWHTFFSYVASGPPAHRLEELLALADAGVVRFLGPQVDIRAIPDVGFRASSPQTAGETTAKTLVDAWLPGSGASISDNAALRQLATEHGAELHVADEDFDGSIGRILVDPEGRVVGVDGQVHASLFAIGPFTSQPEGGAFTRPRSDSLAFRQTDRIAAAVAALALLPQELVQ